MFFVVFLTFFVDLSDVLGSSKRFSSKATQPVPRLRPYSALMESPTTKIRGDVGVVLITASLLNAGGATK